MKEFLLGFVVGFLEHYQYESMLRYFCEGKIKLIDCVDPSKVGMCKTFYRTKIFQLMVFYKLILPI